MHLTPFPSICAIGFARVCKYAYPLVFSLYYLSKEAVLHLYIIFYLMDTWFLFTCNRSAITIVTTVCIEDTKLLSTRKLLSHNVSIAASQLLWI